MTSITTSRRRQVALFTLLYFSEGAPIGFLWWALPTLLRDANLPIERITALTATLVLPWTLKFLWAPIVDVLRSQRWGLRHWITTAQLGMGFCLVPLFWMDPTHHFAAWTALLIAHAMFAATQDVAIDALAIRVVEPEDRGLVNGAMQAGMILGRSLFGGVGILLVSWWGWSALFGALVVAIWSSLLALRAWKSGDGDAPSGMGTLRQVGDSLVHVARSRATWFAVAFALISGAAFEAAGALAGPFMIDRGISKEAVGGFFALPTVVAMLVGGLLGGRISDRWGRIRSVGVFLAGVIVCVMMIAALPAGIPRAVVFGAYGVLYLAIGLFTASSYALFMDLTDPRVGATQFSAFMAATNACEAWATWTGGRLVGSSGYAAAFATMAAISIVGLLVLVGLSRNRAAQNRSVALSPASRTA